MANGCIFHEEVHQMEISNKTSDVEFCIASPHIKSKPNFVFAKSPLF